ncbi:MAG: hypothetical protein GDA50_00500 [Alphaproteobacteria bacterium GM202ARS2]|nr:hypothetical protein [Alphaproteobacteria bacterium GM202ARS2]
MNIVVHVGNHGPMPVATQALADALQQEEQKLATLPPKDRLSKMPLFLLAHRAHNTSTQQRTDIITTISGHLSFERICYRDSLDTPLGQKQQKAWHKPFLWFGKQYTINLQLNINGSSSMMGVVASQRDVISMHTFIDRYDNYLLTALYDMTTSSGSLVLPLCLMETTMTLDSFYDAATLEECHQLETWGADAELEARLSALKQQWRILFDFVRLCRPQ